MKIRIAYYLGTKAENHKANILDRLICAVTRSRYSHLEMVLRYRKDAESSCWSSSPRDGGVRFKKIDLNNGHWEVYEITAPDGITRDSIQDFFLNQNGKKYDWFGALGVYLPFSKQTTNRWFCSEIIARSLGLNDAHRMSPQDVFRYFEHTHRKV